MTPVCCLVQILTWWNGISLPLNEIAVDEPWLHWLIFVIWQPTYQPTRQPGNHPPNQTKKTTNQPIWLYWIYIYVRQNPSLSQLAQAGVPKKSFDTHTHKNTKIHKHTPARFTCNVLFYVRYAFIITMLKKSAQLSQPTGQPIQIISQPTNQPTNQPAPN